MTQDNERRERLRDDGALHPRPERVTSELLTQSEFFDAEDGVQMKYEMLRSVHTDGLSVTEAARSFGLSRVAFYRARRQYRQKGLAGLLPQKRGPKGPHKLTDAIMAFVREQREGQVPPPDWREVSQGIQVAFDVVVNPRSVERAVKQVRKGGSR